MKRIRVGDLVQVIAGKEKGKSGRVTKLIDDRVVVEGLNIVVRHTKPTPRNQEGGIQKKEASIHLSNVMPVDPTTGKPTRVSYRTNDAGKKIRVAKSGAEIVAS